MTKCRLGLGARNSHSRQSLSSDDDYLVGLANATADWISATWSRDAKTMTTAAVAQDIYEVIEHSFAPF